MKRVLSILLAVMLLFSIGTTGVFATNTATPTTSTVMVNGQAVAFEAYNIAGNNYFKLRDLAKVLSGTTKQFEVGWDANNNAIDLVPGKEYTPVGGELTSSGNTGNQSAILSTSAVYFDGIKISLTAYNISGYNYFKLRDVGSAINFGVGWDGTTSTITIDTSVNYIAQSNLSVHFIDVGQGDSTFIIFPDGKTMLIDAGEKKFGDTVVNYIKNQGYNKIDYLVATHPHADHIGGMTEVINNLSIGAVYMPNATTTTQAFADLMTGIKNTGLKVNTAKAGVSIYNSNGVSASIIAPNGNNYDDLNNYSAVIRLVNNNDSFLFMGDAEEVSENEITAAVQADVLKVGHHGSSSSTGQAFLDKVMPRYAVISVGENNDYGHPAKSTIDKLAKVGTTVYRTDQDGTIVFKSDGSKITINKTASIPPVDPGPGSGTKPNIVITGLDKTAELVTIKNTGANDVNLSGWVLVSVTGNQRYTFPTYTLKAGGKVTVASGGAVGDFIWTKSHIWNNSSSDPAELYDAQGNLISTFAD